MNKKLTKKIEAEGDFKLFMYKGYPCVIMRRSLLSKNIIEKSNFFHLCGYVGVPKGHPVWGKGYDGLDLSVHGGLTYASDCLVTTKNKEGIWWLGFDCAHSGDLSYELPELPGHEELHKKWKRLSRYTKETYKDVEYVRKEVMGLADQLYSMEGLISRFLRRFRG